MTKSHLCTVCICTFNLKLIKITSGKKYRVKEKQDTGEER